MGDYYIISHGMYVPINGEFKMKKVPANTQVIFPTPVGTCLTQSALSNVLNKKPGFKGRVVNTEQLYFDLELQINQPTAYLNYKNIRGPGIYQRIKDRFILVDTPIRTIMLSEIVDKNPGKITVISCRPIYRNTINRPTERNLPMSFGNQYHGRVKTGRRRFHTNDNVFRQFKQLNNVYQTLESPKKSVIRPRKRTRIAS